MDDKQLAKQLTLVANGLIMSYVILAKCLKSTGALPEGLLEDSIRASLPSGAEPDRLDYRVARSILNALEGKADPDLHLVH